MAQMYRILGKRGRITIPYEIRQRVGFSQNDVLSFTESPDGRTVLVKREKLRSPANSITLAIVSCIRRRPAAVGAVVQRPRCGLSNSRH